MAGTPIAGSDYLGDGALTREELRAAVLKTASPLNPDGSKDPRFPNPLSYTAEPARYVFEGYGAATPNSGERAVAVLAGEQPLPARPAEDSGIEQPAATEGFTYFLQRTDHIGNGVPGESVPAEEGPCGAHGQFMTRTDTAHDSEPCYSEVATGFVASYRPMGIWRRPTSSTPRCRPARR